MEKVLDASHHPPQRTGCRISELCSKQTGINLNTRFKRYFFARVDEFLADKMKLNPKHSIADLVTKTGAKTGFHVEHILAWNSENKALFDGDEERFEQDRNRLGGILLLKGKDNQSSNKEPYSEKLKSYANTLYWNETLRADSYKSKLDMTALKDQLGLELEALDQFGPGPARSATPLGRVVAFSTDMDCRTPSAFSWVSRVTAFREGAETARNLRRNGSSSPPRTVEDLEQLAESRGGTFRRGTRPT